MEGNGETEVPVKTLLLEEARRELHHRVDSLNNEVLRLRIEVRSSAKRGYQLGFADGVQSMHDERILAVRILAEAACKYDKIFTKQRTTIEAIKTCELLVRPSHPILYAPAPRAGYQYALAPPPAVIRVCGEPRTHQRSPHASSQQVAALQEHRMSGESAATVQSHRFDSDDSSL